MGTVRKFKIFTANQILREINVSNLEKVKNCHLQFFKIHN